MYCLTYQGHCGTLGITELVRWKRYGFPTVYRTRMHAMHAKVTSTDKVVSVKYGMQVAAKVLEYYSGKRRGDTIDKTKAGAREIILSLKPMTPENHAEYRAAITKRKGEVVYYEGMLPPST